MEIREISEDNVQNYVSLVGMDLAENMERTFYRGLAVEGEENRETLALMIWQLMDSEQEDLENVNSIEWFMAKDEEAGEELLKAYGEWVEREEVRVSRFAIPAKPDALERAVLKKAGFSTKLTEGDNIVVKVSEFKNLPFVKKRVKDESVCLLKEATIRMFRKGVYRLTSVNLRGLCEDLSYLPMSWFDPEVSSFSVKDELINGFLLFHREPSGSLSLVLMAALGKEYQKTLVQMMRQSVYAMEEYCTDETRVIIKRHNQAAFQLSEKLFPRGFGTPVYVGERRENG